MPFYTTGLSPGDFLPLFQLMDDYCDTRNISRSKEPAHHKSAATTTTTPQISFTPKFDVREGNDVYILNGELPGAHQDNIEIEFTEPETMVIKGRVERNYDVTSPQIDNDEFMSDDGDDTSSTKSNYHSPTVEDEDETGAPQPARNVAHRHSTPQPEAAEASKYWASERQIGNFQRTFTFPTRINQNDVKASFKNGILSVTVPKEAIKKTKRIRIE